MSLYLLATTVTWSSEGFGASKCVVCGPGKVAPQEGMASCELCPTGSINTDGLDALGGSAHKHDEIRDCKSCLVGESTNDAHTVCMKCGVGTEPSQSG